MFRGTLSLTQENHIKQGIVEVGQARLGNAVSQ
jgi:hypothetical protein